jgi:HSP20 family protein
MREMITLREAMDRLFDDAFTRPLGLPNGSLVPPIDMYQTEEDVVVKAVLPGMKAEDVQISVTGELLTIKGEYRHAEEAERAYQIREQHFGAFERTLSLPSLVVANKAQAEYVDGILTITLPKAEESKPKTISVKVK